jgi:hypothetical protein
MIHRQLGRRRRVKGAEILACAQLFAFTISGSSELASAGELDRSSLPAAVAGPAQCEGGDEGADALKDAGDCKRISGYIAAGAAFGSDEQIGVRRSPFSPPDAPEFVAGARASGAAIIDAPSGQDRFFLPPGADEQAR